MTAPLRYSQAESSTYFLELRILGTVLDAGIIPDLEQSDFRDPDFSAIWGVIKKYNADHGKLDYVILGDYLLRTANLDKRDWFEEVWEHRISDISLLEKYAESLRAHRDRENVTQTISEIWANSQTAEDGVEARDTALEALRKISVRKRREVSDARSSIPAVLDELERRIKSDESGIPTGIPSLDEKLGGWQKGDLVLLAARPKVGKTALACNFALAAKNSRVGFVSTEQPTRQIIFRMLTILSHIPLWKFRSPRNITGEEWARLPSAAETISKRNMIFMDDTHPSVAEIESTFRDSKIDLLIVDYVQRLKAPGEIYERVSSIVRDLKSLARDFDVPVLALSQINRMGAKGASMEHLKGSGDLEQEADQILIMERGESDETQEKHGIFPTALALDANRHGPTGEIALIFNASILQFRQSA